MSIIVNNLSYELPSREPLMSNISFSVAKGQKASLVGANGSGKSTLLKILAGELKAQGADVSVAQPFYYVPQHFGQYDGMTIAEALGIQPVLRSLEAILQGSTDQADFDTVGEDWNIGSHVRKYLDFWGLDHLDADTPFSSMSGGEKTRAFLAGAQMNTYEVVLMDEPTNHLDRVGRAKLYKAIEDSMASMLIVSHDRELLNLVDLTFELTAKGIRKYGGNYDFYKAMRDEHFSALESRIDEKERAMRIAAAEARKAMERKEKEDSRGEKKQKKAGVPRIAMDTLRDGAEKSKARLNDNLTQKVDSIATEIGELKEELLTNRTIKVALRDSRQHAGKILVEAKGVNFAYGTSAPLWPEPLDFGIFSGDRLRIEGNNGSGKTTLLNIIMGALEPTEGTVRRADFTCLYIDQEYSLIDNSLSVLEQVGAYNRRNLPDSFVKTELHRFLFPAPTWDKSCGSLSGGEKMRLMLCCMEVSDDAPDMLILDEPTNNLDIPSMEMLTSVVRDFKGTLFVISHDNRFVEDIGAAQSIVLGN